MLRRIALIVCAVHKHALASIQIAGILQLHHDLHTQKESIGHWAGFNRSPSKVMQQANCRADQKTGHSAMTLQLRHECSCCVAYLCLQNRQAICEEQLQLPLIPHAGIALTSAMLAILVCVSGKRYKKRPEVSSRPQAVSTLCCTKSSSRDCKVNRAAQTQPHFCA